MLGENEALQMSIFIFWVLVCARQIIATSNQAIILSFIANARQKTESLNSAAFSLLKAPPLAASKKRKACAGQALLKRFSMFLFPSSFLAGAFLGSAAGASFLASAAGVAAASAAVSLDSFAERGTSTTAIDACLGSKKTRLGILTSPTFTAWWKSSAEQSMSI